MLPTVEVLGTSLMSYLYSLYLIREEVIQLVIPSSQSNPLFIKDGVPFEDKMVEYIKTHFEDLLGDDVKLLNLDNGLDLVQEKIQRQLASFNGKTEAEAA